MDYGVRVEPQRSPGRQGRPTDPTLAPVILHAVIDVLAEDGYAGLTTATVARRAGVSTATLYRRWPTRRDLVLAAAEAVAPGEDDTDTGSIDGDLRAMLEHKSRALAGRIGSALLSLVTESAHDDELSRVVHGVTYGPTRDRLAQILRRAAARGERPATDPESAALVVVGALMAAPAFRGRGPAPSSAGELLSAPEIDVLVRAVAGTAVPPARASVSGGNGA